MFLSAMVRHGNFWKDLKRIGLKIKTYYTMCALLASGSITFNVDDIMFNSKESNLVPQCSFLCGSGLILFGGDHELVVVNSRKILISGF